MLAATCALHLVWEHIQDAWLVPMKRGTQQKQVCHVAMSGVLNPVLCVLMYLGDFGQVGLVFLLNARAGRVAAHIFLGHDGKCLLLGQCEPSTARLVHVPFACHT